MTNIVWCDDESDTNDDEIKFEFTDTPYPLLGEYLEVDGDFDEDPPWDNQTEDLDISNLDFPDLDILGPNIDYKDSCADCQHLDLDKKENKKKKNQIEFYTNITHKIAYQNGKHAEISTSFLSLDPRSALTSSHCPSSDPKLISDEDLLNCFEQYALTIGKTGQDAKDRAYEAFIATRSSALHSDGEQAFLDFIQSSTDGKSFAVKMGVISSFLQNLNKNYDDTLPSGEVSTTKLLEEVYNDISGNPNGMDAGVCRHMHMLAVKMARKMGIKMSFGLSYATGSGYHLNAVMSNPDNPKETYLVNYGNTFNNENVAGPTALYQDDIPESGVAYHLWGAKDNPVFHLPSEKGGVLHKVTGGKDQDIHPEYKSQTNLYQAGIKVKDNHYVSLFFSKGDIGSGENVGGATYNTKVQYNDAFYGEYGLAAYVSNRDLLGNPDAQLTTTGLYFRTKQGFKKRVVDKDKYKLELASSLNLQGTGYVSLHSGKGIYGNAINNDWKFLGDGSGKLNLSITQKYKTGKILHDTTIDTDISASWCDATKEGGGICFYIQRASLAHDMRLDIPIGAIETKTGIHYHPLDGNHSTTFDQTVKFILFDEKTAIELGVQGPISACPAWLPGCLGQGKVGYYQKLPKAIPFGCVISAEAMMGAPYQYQDGTRQSNYYVGGGLKCNQ